MVYINGRYRNQAMETFDQFETEREAEQALKEYRLVFGQDFRLWLSRRATKEWASK